MSVRRLCWWWRLVVVVVLLRRPAAALVLWASPDAGEEYAHVPASFGRLSTSPPPEVHAARLVLAKPYDLCEPGEPVVAESVAAGRAGGAGAAVDPFVMLAVRGNCNFTDKVTNAQAAGAAGVVVHDDSPKGTRWGVIMSDSGAAADTDVEEIFVPSVFVSFETGEALLDRLAAAWGPGEHEAEAVDLDEAASVPSSTKAAKKAALAAKAATLFELVNAGGRGTDETHRHENVVVLVALNETGNLMLEPRGMGATDRLFLYTAAAVVLFTMSSCIWLLIVLGLAYYYQSHRTWALNQLKETKFVPVGDLPDAASRCSTATAEAHTAGPDRSVVATPPADASTPSCRCDCGDSAPSSPPALSESWSDNSTTCSICLDEYQAGDLLKHLPCGHSFHSLCIVPWFERSVECPLCKRVALDLHRTSVDPDRSGVMFAVAEGLRWDSHHDTIVARGARTGGHVPASLDPGGLELFCAENLKLIGAVIVVVLGCAWHISCAINPVV